MATFIMENNKFISSCCSHIPPIDSNDTKEISSASQTLIEDKPPGENVQYRFQLSRSGVGPGILHL